MKNASVLGGADALPNVMSGHLHDSNASALTSTLVNFPDEKRLGEYSIKDGCKLFLVLKKGESSTESGAQSHTVRNSTCADSFRPRALHWLVTLLFVVVIPHQTDERGCPHGLNTDSRP